MSAITTEDIKTIVGDIEKQREKFKDQFDRLKARIVEVEKERTDLQVKRNMVLKFMRLAEYEEVCALKFARQAEADLMVGEIVSANGDEQQTLQNKQRALLGQVGTLEGKRRELAKRIRNTSGSGVELNNINAKWGCK